MTGTTATEVGETGADNLMADEPMAIEAAFVAKLMTVLETVIAEPGTRVCDPMT